MKVPVDTVTELNSGLLAQRAAKPNVLTLDCGEGKYSVHCRVSSKGVGDKPHYNLVFE